MPLYPFVSPTPDAFREYTQSGSTTYRETMSRLEAQGNAAALATGVATFTAVPLAAGDVITSISVLAGTTAAGTPTHYWFALYDSTRTLIAQTADQLTAAWGSNTKKTLALTGGPFTITAAQAGVGYIAVMVAATTVPTLRGALLVASGINSGTGNQLLLSGTDNVNVGLTTTAAAGPVTLTQQASPFYAILT